MATTMQMPKATMHHDYCVKSGQYNIRGARKAPDMKSEAVSQFVQQLSDHKFGLGIAPFDRHHIPMALLCRKSVNQFQSQSEYFNCLLIYSSKA